MSCILFTKHYMITACMMLCDALSHDNITRTCHLITSCLLFLENMIQQSLCVVFFDEKKHATLHAMMCSIFTFPVQHAHVFFIPLFQSHDVCSRQLESVVITSYFIILIFTCRHWQVLFQFKLDSSVVLKSPLC